jgi:holo-[acyl-carrier-protein] synthase
LAAWLAARGIARVHLSLSDEREQVVAFALAEAE